MDGWMDGWINHEGQGYNEIYVGYGMFIAEVDRRFKLSHQQANEKQHRCTDRAVEEYLKRGEER